MQATNVQRRHGTDEGRRAAWLFALAVAGLMTQARTLWAQTEPDAAQVVSPQQQATRDHDRIEILREELRKSKARLEDLMRRKVERLAASDPKAATEAEEQHVRTLGDIAAIQREIAVVAHASTQSTTVKPTAVQVANSPSASKRAQAPWWDVYGRSRRVEPAASLSLASPPGKVPAGSSSVTGATP
ncbi:hypothetical protein J2W27_004601 [Variovorax boronicumulans]|uniref:hypothetical protein n=1 Tax=Variovorax boronicumulans TaxID=436515 RepID=UPI002789941B|nr:hypothetical protein [Variovorax boronicumulans]MDP9912475.1 hypothetical protein [Variovorax boronicumulans]